MQSPQEKLREEFRKWCNTDNLSDPPSETTEIFDWFLARMIPVEVVREATKQIENIEKMIPDDIRRTQFRGLYNFIDADKVRMILASLETLQAKK